GTGLQRFLSWVTAAEKYATGVIALRLETVRKGAMIPNSIGFGWRQCGWQFGNDVRRCLCTCDFSINPGYVTGSRVLRNRVRDRNCVVSYPGTVAESLVAIADCRPGQCKWDLG